MDIKTLKFLVKVLEVRKQTLFQCEMNCCSWERSSIQGRQEENRDFLAYVKKALKRNENRKKKKDGA